MRKKVSGIICFMTVLLLLAGCGHKTEKKKPPKHFPVWQSVIGQSLIAGQTEKTRFAIPTC